VAEGIGMKKFLLSNLTSQKAASRGLLLLRLIFGLGMTLGHGWGKLMSFSEKMGSFPDPLGISSPLSLGGTVFAEVVCGVLVALGLFTRAATLPLIFTMAVAAFVVHGGDPLFGPGPAKEMALLYLTAYAVLFISGPGTYSIDDKLS
jgi:putative oxidoreductase